MIQQINMPKALALLALLCPAVVLAQQGTYTVNIDFGKVAAKQTVLHRYTLATGKLKDTATVVKGKATIKGTVNERQIGQLSVLGGDNMTSALFYLEPGKIKVDFLPQGGYTVGGTPLNKDYQVYRTLLRKMLDSANAQGGERKHVEAQSDLIEQRFSVIRQFMALKPESAINVDLLNQIGVQYKNQEQMMIAYNKLSKTAKSSPQGKELLNRIKGIGAAVVGNMAPTFTIPDTSGNDLSLASLRGKYVLIDFWATWCGPCMQEMPNLRKAYAAYKDRNFEILGVSLDTPDTKDKWLSLINYMQMTWMHASDLKAWNSLPALLYNVNSVPASFLLDPTGKIVATNLRGEALSEKLAEIIQ